MSGRRWTTANNINTELIYRYSFIECCSRVCSPITTRPSPDPISSNLTDWLLVWLGKTREMFSSWLVVAGTYGRQYLRRAGDTNGTQMTLKAIPIPPMYQIQQVKCQGIIVSIIVMVLHIPVRPKRIFPVVEIENCLLFSMIISATYSFQRHIPFGG